MLFLFIQYLILLDLDHSFEDRLEGLLQRLKDYQTLGKEYLVNKNLIIFSL